VFLVLALFLAGCAKSGATAEAAQFACRVEMFEESRFTVCDPGKGNLELIAAGRDEPPVRRLADLDANLGPKAGTVAFAMNAGMYDDEGRPIGLAIVEGRQKHAINLRKASGNFHLMPNGVFQVRSNGRAEIVTSDNWRSAPDIRIATQSGPMLVIDGKLHPAFEPDGMSRNIRNGVGVTGGKALFVISDDPVSFGKFARFFRDRLKARNALFFDGSVSALWDPANGRRDLTKPLGPMVVTYKPR
jgi:prepilin-type processing-associated H-X9-DG protein